MFAASKTDGAVALAQADPFFDNVTFLLNTSGTNGAQNNTFIDSSTNNFTITRNGNTTQGSFSPYGENWSNYFDGTGDYLSLATNAAFGYGTGAFTIECWFNTQAIPPSAADYLFDQRTTGTQAAPLVYISPSAALEFAVNGVVVITGGTVVVGTWNHFALAKSGTTTRMFLNGVQVGSSYTDNVNYVSTAPVVIGSRFSAEDFYQGYISNFRIIKGTALYTANFTPSTVPLQPVAGTSLLTCRDPNIVDDSGNQFTITRIGDVSVQKFAPFAGTAPATPFYGAYFDGSGDYITLPSNQAQFSMGTGDFTIEMWVNITSLPAERNLYDTLNQSDTQGTGRFAIRVQSNGTVNLFTGSGQEITSGGTLLVGSWYHIAYTRQSTSGRLYVNGVQVNTTTTDTRNYVVGNSNRPIIGANGFDNATGSLLGFISNLRVVKGQALYTASFTPSTVPLTTTSQGATAGNVSLLTFQSNTFIDNSTNNFALTVTGNTRPTTFAPFSLTYSSLQSYTPAVFGGSGYFDGTGDFVTAPANAAFQLTGDFTVEAWIYPTIVNSFNMVFGSENGANSDYLVIRPSTVELAVSNAAYPAWSQTFVVGQWYHVAVTRRSNTLRAFVNGLQLTLFSGSATNSSQFFQSGAAIAVGRYGNPSPSYNFTGHISSARIIKDTALYTSSFVPQNAPLTAVTNTSLLLNATNAGIYDAATLNNFETVGNAQVSTSLKKYGISSMALDGTGDYLIAPSSPFNPVLPFGTGAFTVEFWFYANSSSGTRQLFDTRPVGVTTTVRYMAITYLSGNLNYYTAGANPAISGGAVATEGWNYVALTRSGTSTRLFINGSQVGSTYTDSQDYLIGVNRPIIGADGADPATANFSGNIQDLRLTRGIARYTSTFTPPTAPLPTF